MIIIEISEQQWSSSEHSEDIYKILIIFKIILAYF